MQIRLLFSKGNHRKIVRHRGRVVGLSDCPASVSPKVIGE